MSNKEERDEFLKDLLLCLFFGCLGVHRFARGYITSGVIWLCTFGFLGIGPLLDVIAIIHDKEWIMPK